MRRGKKFLLLVMMLSPAIALTGCQYLGQLVGMAANVLANGNGDWGQMAGQFVGQAAPVAAEAIAQNVGEQGQGGLRDERAAMEWRASADPTTGGLEGTNPDDAGLSGQDQF